MRKPSFYIIPFFCALCSVFLNISSFALAKNNNPLKFTMPIVLCDYNEGSNMTNLKGLSGGDEERPGMLFTTIIRDDGYTRGNSGYALNLDYDVERLGEYTFYWIKLGKEERGHIGSSETLDLRNYNYLSFWIRGAKGEGNIKVELHQETTGDGVFTFGKDISGHVYANAYVRSGAINEEWQRVIIPLKDFAKITDWSRMHELVFVFENRTGNRRGQVYVDDILFGYRSENILLADEVKEMKSPVETSFRVNGVTAKQCLAFKSTNKLEIKAESIDDNPFIESVKFEYSTNGGNIWRTIGIDYDVRKNMYRIDWEPDNSRDLYNYKVRAVATDIKGNEKATGVLIDCEVKPITDDEFLNMAEKKAFEFFRDHQDLKTGLFSDTSGGGDASIASTGFGLTALCVGTERKWIGKEEARSRVLVTLNTFLPQGRSGEPLADGKYGFFYHFLNPHTAKRAGRSEISTVDTAILVAGAITAGEYFGGEVKEKADELYKRVEWEKFVCKEPGPWCSSFSMGWSPERGFLESYWDFYTDEIILISLLAIGSPTHPVDAGIFYTWTRHKESYGQGKPFIYSWHGSLFSYQYAHIWFNLHGLIDRQGIDWFDNSINATLTNRQFCIDNKDKFKGYGPNSWGITSMARPEGYTMHFGTHPMGSGEPQFDGTISPTGPAGSIIFTPYLSIAALKNMYHTYPRLWGQYGFRDSFNLDLNWYAPTYYGIGVAMILLPIENFRSGVIWNNFMKNKHIKVALAKTGFTKAKKRR